MGFSDERIGGGSSFINIKEGKLINDGNTHESFEGTIVSVDIEDAEFKGDEYRKVTLYIQDSNAKVYKLGFNLSSGYGWAFFCICPNIDVTKPVTISAGTEKMENGNSYGKLFVAQDGKSLKWFYTTKNEWGKKIPSVVEQTVGKGKNARIVKDYSERNEYMEKIIAGFYKKVEAQYSKGAMKLDKSKQPADSVTEPIDHLPF